VGWEVTPKEPVIRNECTGWADLLTAKLRVRIRAPEPISNSNLRAEIAGRMPTHRLHPLCTRIGATRKSGLPR